MAPIVLPGLAQQMQQPQAPQQQQPGLLNSLGGMFENANIPLMLAGLSAVGSNKRIGEAVPEAVKMYAMGQSLMNDKDEKEKERRKLQGMTQWYSQPKFIDQFGPEFGKLAQEYPQFAHEVYKDTLRPEGSRTGAIQNFQYWQQLKQQDAQNGTNLADQFQSDYLNKRGGQEGLFSGVIYGEDEKGNIVTGLKDKQTGQTVWEGAQGPVKPIDPASMAGRREQNKANAKLKASMPQAKLSRDTAVDNLNELASRAEEIMKHPGLDRTTGIFSAFPSVPGSAAADVEAKINTLKTQVFIGVIGAMREASKTGGAVGQVTEREMAKLEGAWAALQQSQGTASYKDELRKLVDRAKLSMQRINEAYQEQYGNIAVELPATGQTSGNVEQADPLGIR